MKVVANGNLPPPMIEHILAPLLPHLESTRTAQ
jgi:hypothetical protein